jgi:hypothetical protein
MIQQPAKRQVISNDTVTSLTHYKGSVPATTIAHTQTIRQGEQTDIVEFVNHTHAAT